MTELKKCLGLSSIFECFAELCMHSRTADPQAGNEQTFLLWTTEWKWVLGMGQARAPTAVTSDITTTNTDQTLYGRHGRLWQASRMRRNLGPAQMTIKACRIVVTIVKTGWKGIRQSDRKCLAVSWPALLLRTYLQWWRFNIRTDHDPLRKIFNMRGTTEELERGRWRLTKFDFKLFQPTFPKHQTANGLSYLPTTGMDDSPVEDDVLVLTIMGTWSEGEKTRNNTKCLEKCPCSNVLVVIVTV